MAVNRVEVTINSRTYAVLADESEEYLKKLAGHIDEKVKIVLKNGQNIMGERPLVLAALNICDEYYKCEEAGRVMQKQLAACSEKLARANAAVKSLKAATPQVSFDEQEAEEKIKRTADELRRANDTIRSMEERIKELEQRGAGAQARSGADHGAHRPADAKQNNYNGRGNYGRRN